MLGGQTKSGCGHPLREKNWTDSKDVSWGLGFSEHKG